MKLSKYTTDIVIDEEKSMIYNTLSRQYYLYIRQDKKKIWGFLNNINKGSYTQEEIELFKILLEKNNFTG